MPDNSGDALEETARAALAIAQNPTGGVTPDQAVAAQKAGVPPALVKAGYTPPVPLAKATSSYINADYHHAQVSSDDIQNLNNISDKAKSTSQTASATQAVMQYNKLPVWARQLIYSGENGGGQLGALATNAPSGAIGMLQSIPGLQKNKTLESARQFWENSSLNKQFENWENAGRNDPEYNKKRGEGVGYMLRHDPAQAALDATDFVLQQLPTFLATLGVGVFAAPEAAGYGLAALTATQGDVQAREEGSTPGQAAVGGGLKGLVQGALGLLPGRFLKGPLGDFMQGVISKGGYAAAFETVTQGLDSALGKIAKNVVSESLTGASFSAANDLIDRMTGSKEKHELSSDMLAGAGGFALMGGLTGLFHDDAPRVQEAADSKKQLEDLRPIVQASKTAKRAPEAFKQFMLANAAHLNGSYRSMPLEEFEATAATRGQQPYDFARSLGPEATQGYIAARREGSSVMIPVSNILGVPEDETFKRMSDNVATLDGTAVTPNQARTLAAQSAKREPYKWADTLSSMHDAYTRQMLGMPTAKLTPELVEQARKMSNAFESPDANEIGPEFMKNTTEGLPSEGPLDTELRKKYGVEKSTGEWPKEQLEKFGEDFKDYLSNPDHPKDDVLRKFKNTLEATYLMRAASGKETHSSVFASLTKGRLAAKQALIDLGQAPWLKRTGDEKLDGVLDDAENAVTTKIVKSHFDKMNKEKLAQYTQDYLATGVKNSRSEQARMMLKAGQSPEDVVALAGYKNLPEMKADLRVHNVARDAQNYAKQRLAEEQSGGDYQDTLHSLYASEPLERLNKMVGKELLRQNPQAYAKLRDMADAIEEEHDKLKGSLMSKGIVGLGLSKKPPEAIKNQIRADLLDRQKDQMRPEIYLKDREIASAKAHKAWSKGDENANQTAALWHGVTTYNMEAYRQSLLLQKAFDMTGRILTRLSDEEHLKRLPPDMADAVRDTLGRFGKVQYTPGRMAGTLKDFIETRLHGSDAADIPLDPGLSEKLRGDRLNLNDLTGREYLSLGQTLKMLQNIGSKETAELKGAKKAALESDLQTIRDAPKDRVTLWKGTKGIRKLAEIQLAAMTEPAEIGRMLRGGPIEKRVIEPVRAAEQERAEKVGKAMSQFAEALGKPELKESYKLPEELSRLTVATGDPSLTGGEFLGMLGTMGDAESFQDLVKGHNVDENVLKDYLLKNSTKEQWDSVEKIANTLEWVGLEHDDMLRKNNLQGMHFVKKVPFEAFGARKGWYWPISHDPDLNQWMKETPEDRPSFTDWSNTRTKHEKTRIKSFSRPMDVDITKLPGVLHSLISDTALRVPVHEAKEFLGHPEVKAHISSVLGDGYHAALIDSMKNLVSQPHDRATWEKSMDTTLSLARHNYTIAHMTLRLGISALHLAGSTVNSLVETFPHPTTLFKGRSMYAQNPKLAREFMTKESPEMRGRLSGSVDQDTLNFYEDVRNKIGEQSNISWTRNKLDAVATTLFHIYSATNNLVAMPLFLGEYERQAKNGGTHAEAIKSAEDLVRKVAGPSNRFDMGALMGTHNELVKNLTLFTSYWNHNANRLEAHLKALAIPKRMGIPSTGRQRAVAIAGVLAYSVVAPLIHQMAEGNQVPQPDDKDALAQFLERGSVNIASGVFMESGPSLFGPAGTKLSQALLRLNRAGSLSPHMESLLGPLAEITPAVKSAQDSWGLLTGDKELSNMSPGTKEKGEISEDNYYGEFAGGVASMFGIPMAEAVKNAVSFVHAVDRGDWEDSDASFPRKAWVGITTGRIPQQ